ncbi:MAG TPA: aminotransferase class IV [Opitutaceae bacterium]
MKPELVILNGRLGLAAGSRNEPEDAIGVFETLEVAGGRPQRFDEHADRFAAGCRYYGLSSAPTAAEIAVAAGDLIDARAEIVGPEGVLRWSAWSSALQGSGWQIRFEPSRPDTAKPVWRVAVSPLRIPEPGPEARFKHLGRRMWREALALGKAAGLEEVLLADRSGLLVEGSRANVFVELDGRLWTPAPDLGLLPGVVRANVIAFAAELAMPVQEGRISLAELGAAEGMFFTNSLIGIKPVSELDGQALPGGGELISRLMTAWRSRR